MIDDDYNYINDASPKIQEAIRIEETFLGSDLEDSSVLKLFYIDMLKKLLQLTEDDYEKWGYAIIYEIKTHSEFKQVIEYCISLKNIKRLRRKDQHNEKRPEKKFLNAKNKFIKELQLNGQEDEIKKIRKISFIPNPNYEDMIKIHKKILFTLLTGYIDGIKYSSTCNTPKDRAVKIIKILNKI